MTTRRKFLTGAIGAMAGAIGTLAAFRAIPAQGATSPHWCPNRHVMGAMGYLGAGCEFNGRQEPITDEPARGHPSNGNEDCNTHPVLCKQIAHS